MLLLLVFIPKIPQMLKKKNSLSGAVWTCAQMACAGKCQRDGMNCKESWISLHKWWARMAPRCPDHQRTVYILHQNTVLHTHIKINLSGIKTCFLFSTFFLFHSSCSRFFSFFLSWFTFGPSECYMGCWRWSQGKRPDILPHIRTVIVVVVPFFPLHHFSGVWQCNRIFVGIEKQKIEIKKKSAPLKV